MFVPGQSGNPGGRPAISPEVKQAAREYSIEAIETLAAIMRNTEARDADRIKSSEVLLNRAWGTPTQSVELAGAIQTNSIDYDKLTKEQKEAIIILASQSMTDMASREDMGK